MFHVNARSNSRGFTLIEVLVVMIMIGILSAIAAPSFMGLLNRNRVSNATIRLKSSLVEAQANTIRIGKSCTATIPVGLSVTLSGTCWRTGAETFTDVTLSIVDSAATPPTSLPITFDFKGRVTTAVAGSTGTGGSDTRAIVISQTNTTYQRCVMISYPLGIVRMGTYTSPNCAIDP